MTKVERRCYVCNKKYHARQSDLNRGMGLTCSKSCGSKKREIDKKPDY